jgi:hypothetical protein
MPRARLFLLALALVAALVATPRPTQSQQRSLDLIVNKAELLRFDRHPGSVLVVNPQIADVVADGGNHVFILGKIPGETQLFVLDEDGKTMMQANVRVGTPASGQVSVFRGTAEATLNCAPRCAGLQSGTPAAAAGGAASPTAGASAAPAAAPAAPAPSAPAPRS